LEDIIEKYMSNAPKMY